MARVSHKRVKQLLNEHRSKITDNAFLGDFMRYKTQKP